MRNLFILIAASISLLGQQAPTRAQRPVHTFSIVARIR